MANKELLKGILLTFPNIRPSLLPFLRPQKNTCQHNRNLFAFFNIIFHPFFMARPPCDSESSGTRASRPKQGHILICHQIFDKSRGIYPSPSPLPQGPREIEDTLLFSSGCTLNSDASRLMKEEFKGSSKGIQNPLRAYARASPGSTIPSFTPEG